MTDPDWWRRALRCATCGAALDGEYPAVACAANMAHRGAPGGAGVGRGPCDHPGRGGGDAGGARREGESMMCLTVLSLVLQASLVFGVVGLAVWAACYGLGGADAELE